MDRLTQKIGEIYVREIKSNDFHIIFDKINGNSCIIKDEILGQFEDFLEQEDFTGLEDLKAYIKHKEIICDDFLKQNQALKDRWQKLKEFVKEKGYNYFKKGLFFEIEDDYANVLFKMQELENVSDTNVGNKQ